MVLFPFTELALDPVALAQALLIFRGGLKLQPNPFVGILLLRAIVMQPNGGMQPLAFEQKVIIAIVVGSIGSDNPYRDPLSQVSWTKSLRQRCLAHKVKNVVDKVPESARAEVKSAVNSAYRAPNREIAEMIASDVLKRYQDLYPSAVKSFMEDLEACWAHLRCPSIHHKRIRTTNLLERAFGEQKRRTKVIPRFMTEQSCLKLVFATLWQTSARWRGFCMSEFEQQQLLQLRVDLGLKPDPIVEEKLHRAA